MLTWMIWDLEGYRTDSKVFGQGPKSPSQHLPIHGGFGSCSGNHLCVCPFSK